jgi:hypothetical protein
LRRDIQQIADEEQRTITQVCEMLLQEGYSGGAQDAPFCAASVFNNNSRHFCINESKRHHWPLPHI